MLPKAGCGQIISESQSLSLIEISEKTTYHSVQSCLQRRSPVLRRTQKVYSTPRKLPPLHPRRPVWSWLLQRDCSKGLLLRTRSADSSIRTHSTPLLLLRTRFLPTPSRIRSNQSWQRPRTRSLQQAWPLRSPSRQRVPVHQLAYCQRPFLQTLPLRQGWTLPQRPTLLRTLLLRLQRLSCQIPNRHP